MLQAVEVGLLQGLVDVEVGALAQRGWLGRGLWGVGAWPGGEMVQAALRPAGKWRERTGEVGRGPDKKGSISFEILIKI